ncbi:peptidoglycan-binding protein [Streptomyces sp. BV129]|uniref:peptidoglycan-binding protein n=1 Tax=Streptomyces sp. BV129 TaxID=2849671 RepID=UPI001C2E719A|nr:peptidoglycan-binding domain-containing protein [Streptomyces sp. BV129]MBV1946874.1 peptidoglycan-binding protein [Streptomyces sp. BV129]
MPTPPDPERPRPTRVVEPVRVLRARPTDALAELMRELMPEQGTGVRSEAPARPAEDDTEELPPVPPEGLSTGTSTGTDTGEDAGARSTRRRWAVGLALAAAALTGFGCALLLPGRQEATARPASPPVTTTASATAPASPAPADPDGPGTLRQGDSGPEVTELRRRLLRIPDVFRDGSATGAYDPGLTSAVARFQLWYGIRGDEDGVYGDDTRRALESRTGTE